MSPYLHSSTTNSASLAGPDPAGSPGPRPAASEAPSADHSATYDTSAIPAWFRRKQVRRAEPPPATSSTPSATKPEAVPPTSGSATAARPPAKIRIKVGGEEPLPWKQRLWAIVIGSTGAGYAVSALVHTTLFAILGLWVATGTGGRNGSVALLVSNDSTHEQPGFDDSLDTRIDIEGGQTSGLTLDSPVVMDVPSDMLSPQKLPDLGAASSKTGSGEGKGLGDLVGDGLKGGGFAMPAPGNFVRRGSFSAWTVPKDPVPGEGYLIIIQVEMPRGRLKFGDVTGTIVGTDNYKQKISPYSKYTQYLSKSNQVVVRVPGADENVRDVIKVQSQVLGESQELEIVF
jgi:hypothetical protein